MKLLKSIKDSRISMTAIVAIVTGMLMYFADTGVMSVALVGLIIFTGNALITAIGQFKLTGDGFMFAIALMGLINSALQLILKDNIFPALNPAVLNAIMAFLILVIRQFSTPINKVS